MQSRGVASPSLPPARDGRGTLLLGVPLLLTLHNAEEALTASQGLARLGPSLPDLLLPTAAAMRLGLGATALGAWLVWARCRRKQGRMPWLALLVAIQSLMLANVGWHVFAAWLLRGYAPGLLTALLLNLPFSIVFLARAWRERWLRREKLATLLTAATLLHAVPVAILLWMVDSPLPVAR